MNQKITIKHLLRKISPRRRAYETNRQAARVMIVREVTLCAEDHGVLVGRIAIKDQRRSWGSCSALGNLNFSYRLLFLPPCLRRYIILHELAHRRELNHSRRFWVVVADWCPWYLTAIKTLRALERSKGTSLPVLRAFAPLHAATCPYCIDLMQSNNEHTATVGSVERI